MENFRTGEAYSAGGARCTNNWMNWTNELNGWTTYPGQATCNDTIHFDLWTDLQCGSVFHLRCCGGGQNAIFAASIAFSLQSPITALPTHFHDLIRTFIHPLLSGEQFCSFYFSIHSLSMLFCFGTSFHFHLSRLWSVFTSLLDCRSSTG